MTVWNAREGEALLWPFASVPGAPKAFHPQTQMTDLAVHPLIQASNEKHTATYYEK